MMSIKCFPKGVLSDYDYLCSLHVLELEDYSQGEKFDL